MYLFKLSQNLSGSALKATEEFNHICIDDTSVKKELFFIILSSVMKK